RGRVIADEAQRPLPNARVTARLGSGVVEPVFTDGSGRFILDRLAPGRYFLTTEKAGFASTRFGASDLLDPPTPIEVPNEGDGPTVEIRMLRGAAITGRVVDDSGAPISGSRVTL